MITSLCKFKRREPVREIFYTLTLMHKITKIFIGHYGWLIINVLPFFDLFKEVLLQRDRGEFENLYFTTEVTDQPINITYKKKNLAICTKKPARLALFFHSLSA